MKFGFIGCGKMATALAQGVLKAGVCAPGDLVLSDAIPAAAEKLAKATGGTGAASNAEVLATADVLILAVKPGDAIAAVKSLPAGQMESTMRWAWKSGAPGESKLLLSIVAGLPIAAIEA